MTSDRDRDQMKHRRKMRRWDRRARKQGVAPYEYMLRQHIRQVLGVEVLKGARDGK